MTEKNENKSQWGQRKSIRSQQVGGRENYQKLVQGEKSVKGGKVSHMRAKLKEEWQIPLE